MASEKKCYFIAVDFSKVIDTFKAQVQLKYFYIIFLKFKD